MDSAFRSLSQIYPKTYDPPFLLLTAILLLIAGLSLPIITFNELIFWTNTFSVLTGIFSLYHEKEYLLALIVFLFSVVFPIIKLFMLSWTWFRKMSGERRTQILHRLGYLGKWSMLDVFVVAILVVLAKISKLMEAKPEVGIYVFGASILLSMAATIRLERLATRTPKN